jgi:hypothetical protein
VAESFEVEPHYVSGYGDLLAAEHRNMGDVRYHVDFFARANPEYYEGLLALLTTPVNQYADSVWYRLGTRAGNLDRAAQELHGTAWAYLGLEEENTERFQGELRSDPDEDAVPYPASSPDLPSLEVTEMDFSEEFKDLSTATFFIVWFLQYYLGWSPHNYIMEKLAGNWNALDVAGDALINVGNAAEQMSVSLEDGLGTLDGHWHGGAAQACVDYVTRLAGALGEEGPLNRTVGKLYKTIAEQAIEAIRQVIRDLTLPVEDVGRALGYVKVCWVWVPSDAGSFEDAVALMDNYKELFDAARSMVETIEAVVEQAKEFVATAEQVSDTANLDGAVAAIVDSVAPWGDQVQEGIVTSADLADLANTSEFADAPSGDYSSGDDLERDGA